MRFVSLFPPQFDSDWFALLQWVVALLKESQLAQREDQQHALPEVRAIYHLLKETHAIKSELALTHWVHYLDHLQSEMNKYNAINTAALNSATVSDFLREQGWMILLNEIDYFIFIAHFLSLDENHNPYFKWRDYYASLLPTAIENVICAVSRDISQLKKSEALLQIAKKKAIAANKMKSDFIHNMRHDIRTPLTGIVGFARLIQEKSQDPDIKDYADHLVEATNALLNFQNQLLSDIHQLEKNEEQNKEHFYLRDLIESVIHLTKPKAITKSLTLSVNQSATLPSCLYGDAKRLFRIVLELVVNAIKFTTSGSVEVAISDLKQTSQSLLLQIEVKDTGIGIPEDKYDAIFTRFCRLSPSSEGVYEGTGLGLSIVKKYIADMDGKIKVRSHQSGGTIMTCVLPFEIGKINTQNQATVTNHHTKTTQTLSLLIIEDHPMTASVTQLSFQPYCRDMDVVNNAAEAKNLLKKKRYDCILMDLGLPDENGFMLAKTIRQNYVLNADTTIIAFTAHLEPDYQSHCDESGINAIYQKPLLGSTIHELICMINKPKKTVIDLALGANRLSKGLADAKYMLNLLLQQIDDEENKIKTSLMQQDYHALSAINHKLLGGLSYCGAPRLEDACIALQSVLKKQDAQLIAYHAKNVLSEITALKSAAKSELQ